MDNESASPDTMERYPIINGEKERETQEKFRKSQNDEFPPLKSNQDYNNGNRDQENSYSSYHNSKGSNNQERHYPREVNYSNNNGSSRVRGPHNKKVIYYYKKSDTEIEESKDCKLNRFDSNPEPETISTANSSNFDQAADRDTPAASNSKHTSISQKITETLVTINDTLPISNSRSQGLYTPEENEKTSPIKEPRSEDNDFIPTKSKLQLAAVS